MQEILRRVQKGELSPEEAEKILKVLTIQEVENLAKLDPHRDLRKGIPEVIFAEGKTPEDAVKISHAMLKNKGRVIISRVPEEHAKLLKESFRDCAEVYENTRARMLVLKQKGFVSQKTGGRVGIVTAGTADTPIAEQAKVIAEEMGCEVFTFYDVGVAAIHRVFPSIQKLLEKDISAIIVVAGMEGALPSVICGLVDIPVIGVPTSVGYGIGGQGITALLSMLQSCTPGLTVVNIDNGIGAGATAALIANRYAKSH
ncbi:MAG: nickel pincer cofactor biosynthesis protein LarB [Candidatus Bathyarchaeia archaeon]